MLTSGQKRYRHELKYLVSASDALVLSKRLGAVLPHDAHAGPDGRYTVRSLYFDTPRDRALREKSAGESSREKWRLRTYGTGAGEAPFNLERKIKIDGVGRKESARLERAGAEALIACSWRDIDPGGDRVLEEFLRCMRGGGLIPRTVVVYEREAFRYAAGNVRITLDANMRSSPRARALIDPKALLMPIEAGSVVLEVKFDAFLPSFIRNAIQTPGAVRTAWSKYALARRFE